MNARKPGTQHYPRYRDWAPTQYDAKGLGLPDRQDWRVVAFRSRGTKERDTRFNERRARRAQAEEAGMVEVHCFNHWVCGWFEILLQSPDYIKWCRQNRKKGT